VCVICCSDSFIGTRSPVWQGWTRGFASGSGMRMTTLSSFGPAVVWADLCESSCIVCGFWVLLSSSDSLYCSGMSGCRIVNGGGLGINCRGIWVGCCSVHGRIYRRWLSDRNSKA
jgi:hypothetical protein